MSTHSLLLVGLGATVQDAGQSLIALATRLDNAWEMRRVRPVSHRLPFLP